MIYKNSIKLLFSNFSIVWKMMLYFLCLFLISGFLIFLFVNPIVKMIENAGFFSQFIDMYTDYLATLDLPVLFQNLGGILNNLFTFISENMSDMWFWFLGIIFVLFFVLPFTFNLSNMACCQSLHLYISSMNKQGFFTSYFDNFVKNLRFQLVYYFVTLPLNLLYIYLFVLSLNLFGISLLMNFVAILIIVLGSIVLLSFKKVLFSVWCPTVVVLNLGLFKSLKTSLKIVFKKFGRYFSNAIGIVLTIIVLNVMLGLSTFLVGLIISIPISYLLNNIFGMVSLFEGQGMRYYVDVYNVITPKKKEVSDTLNDMKYIV